MKTEFEKSLKKKLNDIIEEDKRLMRELTELPKESIGSKDRFLTMKANTLISDFIVGILTETFKQSIVELPELYYQTIKS